jgi:hypothetical protein
MARTVRDANLESRTARLRLPIRSEPYWRGLERGFALGYRRRGKGGTWLARRRPAVGGYVEHKIGTRDDLQDADGVAILDYGQAQKAARAWWRAELRREEGHDPRSGPYMVAAADATSRALIASAGSWRRHSLRCSRGDAHSAGSRDGASWEADGQENPRLAPGACRQARIGALETRPQAKPPEGREERGWRS